MKASTRLNQHEPRETPRVLALSSSGLTEIPARRGRAVRADKGREIKLVNTHGTQVVDTWAFNAADLHEFMSMEHTRPHIGRIIPKVGDILYTNKRRPILTLVKDTSPGVHDTIIAACDKYRYKFLGFDGYHDNCTDNLYAGMAEIGLTPPETPSPLNMWMNIPVKPDGTIGWLPTVAKPGDFVLLRAEMDVVMAFSACPQDLLPINGPERKPVECHFQVI